MSETLRAMRKLTIGLIVLVLIMLVISTIGSFVASKGTIEFGVATWVLFALLLPIIGICVFVIIVISLCLSCLKLKDKYKQRKNS